MNNAELPGPATWLGLHFIWSAILRLRGSWGQLGLAWQSLLAQPGDLLYERESNMCGVVLRSTEWGVLLARASACKVDGANFGFVIRLAPGELQHEFAVVTNYNKWKAQRLDTLPPVSTKKMAFPANLARQVVAWAPPDKPPTGL